jgi:hypothetical protein
VDQLRRFSTGYLRSRKALNPGKEVELSGVFVMYLKVIQDSMEVIVAHVPPQELRTTIVQLLQPLHTLHFSKDEHVFSRMEVLMMKMKDENSLQDLILRKMIFMQSCQ